MADFDLLCIGDTTYCTMAKVDRLPDKDGLCWMEETWIDHGGGPANTACHSSALNLKTAFCGSVGTDYWAQEMKDHFDKCNVINYLAKNEGASGNMIALIERAGRKMLALDLKNATKIDLSLIPKEATFEKVYLGPTDRQVMLDVLDRFENVYLGPQAEFLDDLDFFKLLCQKVKGVFCNDSEALKYFEARTVNEAFENSYLDMLAVTHGKRGSTVFTEDKVATKDSFRVNEVDAWGAGDAYVAGFFYGWKRKDVEYAALCGNAAGALNVGRKGMRMNPVKEEQLTTFLKKEGVETH